MANNIFQQMVVPDKPKVLAQERIFVYVPSASEGGKGLASFNQRDFNSPAGHVSLRWPMEMLVGQLADPTARPALTKLLSDEFVKTSNPVTVVNPVTGITYTSNTAEVKLNRVQRDATVRPELVMLNPTDFEAVSVVGPNNERYNQYKLPRKNPLVDATIFKVDNDDFLSRSELSSSVVQVNWPYAHNPGLGTDKTQGFGLVRISGNSAGNLNFDGSGNLRVDTNALKVSMRNHWADRVAYGESDPAKWSEINTYYDADTGLAKRNADGNTLLSITKQAVGLSDVENRSFASRTYDEFGAGMKSAFNSKFDAKLDRALWDGPTGLFKDWKPPTDDRNTVQRWFMRLEEEDNSIWSSIRSSRLFLGFFDSILNLSSAYPPQAIYFGDNAFVVESTSYWAVRASDVTRYQYVYRDNVGLESITGQIIGDRAVNLNDGKEYVWDNSRWVYDGIHNEEWEWYDTQVEDLSFSNYIELDAAQLQPNAPVANVSVGISGKWIQSDHIHPSDPGKLDAWLMEDANITVTTNPPSGNDFFVKLADVTILDNELNPIEATIVTTAQYLNSVPNPQENDLAITRNHGQIYKYNGESWIFTEKVGSITYNTETNINLPYIRTTQYLHNWKTSPTEFQQNGQSNEYYWGGSKAEFASLNLDDIPNGAFIHVDDGEDLEPGHFATISQLDTAGLRVTSDEFVSTERFVTVDRADDLVGLPVTLTSTSAVPYTRGERRKLEALNFGAVQPSPSPSHRMAITVPDENGHTTLSHRSFQAGRMIQSDMYGNLASSIFNPANMILTNEGADLIPLAGNAPTSTVHLIRKKGDRVLETWNTGEIPLKLIATDGSGGAQVVHLTPNKGLISGPSGAVSTSTWRSDNVVTTSVNGELSVLLTPNSVVLSGGNNQVTSWNSGGVPGSLITRGSDNGSLQVRTHASLHRLIATAVDGQIVELGSGLSGQYLTSTGANSVPGWSPGPVVPTSLPQKLFTSNPPAEVANALTGGLAAVILQSAPAVADMRNNCIYYY